MARARARDLGLEAAVAGIRSVDTHVAEIGSDSDALAEAMISAGTAAVEQDGAEVLGSGRTSLAFAETHTEVQDRLPGPVVDPLAVSPEQAATWARHGILHSRHSYPPTPEERRSEL